MDENRKDITLRHLLGVLNRSGGMYGYDFWMPERIHEQDLLWHCAVEILQSEPPPPYVPPTSGRVRVTTFGGRGPFGANPPEMETAEAIYPLACDILWQLCLLGVLRPGIRQAGGQSVDQGIGYSLTLRGRDWVKAPPEEDVQKLLAAL